MGDDTLNLDELEWLLAVAPPVPSSVHRLLNALPRLIAIARAAAAMADANERCGQLNPDWNGQPRAFTDAAREFREAQYRLMTEAAALRGETTL